MKIAVPAILLMAHMAQAECRRDQAFLRGDWGQARFTVEIADNAIAIERGLMGRESMPMTAGMLFIYHSDQELWFWMKNTLIPLDIVFLDRTGRVIKIHHRARPLDLTPLPSEGDARYVLEINGGLARALGMDIGTQLRHPAVLQHEAAWPCRKDS